MKKIAASAVVAALALTGASFSAGSAMADKVVVKKETTYKTTNRPANVGVGVAVAPGVAIVAPGIAVAPGYETRNCKKTVKTVDRPGNQTDKKVVKTNC